MEGLGAARVAARLYEGKDWYNKMFGFADEIDALVSYQERELKAEERQRT